MSELTDQNWYSNDAATFGDRVAAAREAQGLSQKDLSKKLGIGLKTLEGWENDMAEPRANKLQMLAGVLNVSLSWILTGDGQAPEDVLSEDDQLDLVDLMTEMRVLRTQMAQAADRMGVLEKRLKTAILDRAV
ncbi:helix-turn-helix transcriptional regulator [uncultured Boseongicola sp.]|jgi:transcriptional regulator with XRE-family HTH domain|uniref:helix-turn-helix domain-containing protein n=1 Tax=uncultured Boseongicola sp. TaxID=1648499 RepID=UPI00262C83EA|nr:helix-turn-helix transcriptional regulator [uncultured Boseongicola sp.]